MSTEIIENIWFLESFGNVYELFLTRFWIIFFENVPKIFGNLWKFSENLRSSIKSFF